MAQLSDTKPLDDTQASRLTADEVAVLSFVAVITSAGVGALLWALGQAAHDMMVWLQT